MAYKLSDLGGVSDSLVKSLQAQGINDTVQLLLATADSNELVQLANNLGISVEMVADLAGRADLLRVPGIGPIYANLLNASGINSMAELRAAGPDLHDQLIRAGETLGVRGLPTTAEVNGWVLAAQAMPDVGDWAIATRSEALRAGFAADDWVKIKLAPLAAAALVVSASPSDQTDTAVELWAAAAALNEARAEAHPDALINVAFGADISADDISNFMADAPGAATLDTIKEATALAAATVSAEQFAEYQSMILDVAWKVAEASREGSAGFLGIGRKKIVSDQEKAVVEEIRLALGG